MAQITITIDTDNAAFEDNPNELEKVIRILGHNLTRCFSGHMVRNFAALDSNGNTCGTVTITE